MPSANRIIDRLPSLYRPELTAADLFTVFVRAIGDGLDDVSKASSDVMQAHWFSYSDGALFSEFVRRSRELTHQPPVQRTDEIVEGLPYLADLPRLAALLDRAPWLDPPLSRDHVEDFRRRLADLVILYRLGLGTLAAIRLATRIALPISDRGAPLGLRTRPFTVEEFAPLHPRTLPIAARGQPLDLLGPLMRWSIDSNSQAPVLPTAFIRGVAPVIDRVDATTQPLLERVQLNDNTGVGLAYLGDLAPDQTLALWPAYTSWLATAAGTDTASSVADAQHVANPTAPGPWTTIGGGPVGIAVAFFQAADRFLWAAVNDAGIGSVWRTDGGPWLQVLNGLPEVRCLIGHDADLLIGMATGLSALALYEVGAVPTPDPATLNSAAVNALAADASGQLWAATSTGVARVTNDLRLTPVGPGALAATQTSLHCAFVDADGTLFFGGDLGVFQFQPVANRWYHYAGAAVDESSPDWLPFDPTINPLPAVDTVFLPPVHCITRGADAALWLGTNNGIARYLARENRRTFTTLLEAFPAVTQLPVRALATDERGQLWFATDTGLFVFDGADWWQRQGTDLKRLFNEPLVRTPLERGVSELTFFRFVRSTARWQSLTPIGSAGFVVLNPVAIATQEPAVNALIWTDGVHHELGSFDGAVFTPSADAPAAVRVRFKPDALRVLDGGIPALPRLLPGNSDWRYLALEPAVVPLPTTFPAWTVEGRLLPEPERGVAPLEGRYLANAAQELRDQVFSFNPAAQVWMRWTPRELLAVLVRLRRMSADEVVDPLVLDRVFDEVNRVRPAAVRIGLAVDDRLVRVN